MYQDRIERIRIELGKAVPFLRSVSLRHNIIVSDSEEGIGWNDGKGNVYFTKKFFQLPEPEQVFIYWHELEHWLRGHFSRMKNRDKELWNAACDIQINADMKQYINQLPSSKKMYISVPYYALMDEELAHNRSAEMIYKELEQRDGNVPKPGKEVEDRSELGEEESKAQLSTVEKTLERVVLDAKQQGSLPGYMEEWVTMSSERVSLPIEQYLSKELTRGGGGRSTYSRPNHRRSMYGVIAPSRLDEVNKSIDFIIDTSGSMWEEIRAAIKALNYVKDLTGKTVRVIQVDYKVQEVKEYAPNQAIPKFKILGGGGTSFKPGFEEVRPTTTDIIYLTDGYCFDFPKPPRGKNVIWVLTKDCYPNFKPPFGKVIHI